MLADKIKVLIVDDFTSVRHGLSALLETAPDMVVVGEAEDGQSAIQQVRQLRPDVIIMDLVMPGLDSFRAIELITSEWSHVSILVLSNDGEDAHVLAAIRAGARGYLIKESLSTEIVKAIRVVYDGSLVMHRSVTHALTRALRN